MTRFSMPRQTDKAGAPKRDKSGPGRRNGEKTDKNASQVLCGWNLPTLPDDNDLMSWMKREKAGDNNRKKINEVYEEERYRHIALGHCSAIENKMLFDRQSLNDRYLKNCQFGVRDGRAKVAPVASVKPTPQTARVPSPDSPSDNTRDRKCFSATAMADENKSEEKDDTMTEVSMRPALSRGRSHSAGLRSASLRAYGMTLPNDSRHNHSTATATATTTATTVTGGGKGKEAGGREGEGEEWDEKEVWDEGYGSKVSSNDQEPDGAEEERLKGLALEDNGAAGGGVVSGGGGGVGGDNHQRLHGGGGGGGGEGGVVSLHKVGPVLNHISNNNNNNHHNNTTTTSTSNTTTAAHQLSHQDAMAKLMYSRRDRTVYERLPSRRMRGNSFRYAGREQSRLTEASLSNITPGYLARYHHLADLATTHNSKHGKHQAAHNGNSNAEAIAAFVHLQQQSSQQQGSVVDSGGAGVGVGAGAGMQPRTMVLRKITMQDSATDLFSQNVHLQQRLSCGEALPLSSPSSSSSPKASPPHLHLHHHRPQKTPEGGSNVYKRQGVLSPPPPPIPACRNRSSERSASDKSKSSALSDVAQSDVTAAPGSMLSSSVQPPSVSEMTRLGVSGGSRTGSGSGAVSDITVSGSVRLEGVPPPTSDSQITSRTSQQEPVVGFKPAAVGGGAGVGGGWGGGGGGGGVSRKSAFHTPPCLSNSNNNVVSVTVQQLSPDLLYSHHDSLTPNTSASRTALTAAASLSTSIAATTTTPLHHHHLLNKSAALSTDNVNVNVHNPLQRGTATTTFTSARTLTPSGGLMATTALVSGGSPPGTDRLSMSTFAMTDLLPAVERNLHIQRHAQRGISNSKAMDVMASVNNIHQRRQQQQERRRQQLQEQQQQQQQKQHEHESEAGVSGLQDMLSGQADVRHSGASTASSARKGAADNVRSFPAFRPHHNITPLQRAKEIANRRIHGHVAQMPDGSEAVRVPSPQYASIADRRNSYTRAKSASRFPPLLRQRTHHASSGEATSKGSYATSLSKSHSSLFTREDMASRLKQPL